MKKIFTIFVFVAATSFSACDQDLTGYEVPNQSDNESQDLSYAEGVSSSRLVFATNLLMPLAKTTGTNIII
ncbi:MAG: hypothetical protein IJX68_02935 [Rikenellaceae bacterium]|nr:hypothetical protein [Rikenellaceae bacterium]